MEGEDCCLQGVSIMAKRTTWLPTTDIGLLNFSENMRQSLPVVVARLPAGNVRPEEVAAFEAAAAAYASAYRAAHSSALRTPTAVSRKNTTRAELVAIARRVVACLQAYPEMTDSDRALLRITIRKKGRRRLGAPQSVPVLQMTSVRPRAWSVKVKDELRPWANDKPEGVAGVRVFYTVGEVVSTDPNAWKRMKEYSRCRFEVEVPLNEQTVVAGTRVWWAARWINRHQEPGPWGKAVCGYTRHPADGAMTMARRKRQAA